LNVRHIMILYKEGTYLKPVSSSWLQVHKLWKCSTPLCAPR
jgi:hypothetical protein